jgi:hypothetical protein
MASAKGKGLAAVIRANPSFVDASQATTESSYDGNTGGGVSLFDHPDPSSPPQQKMAPFEAYASKQRGEGPGTRAVNPGNQSNQAASTSNKPVLMTGGNGSTNNGKGKKKQQQGKSAMKGNDSTSVQSLLDALLTFQQQQAECIVPPTRPQTFTRLLARTSPSSVPTSEARAAALRATHPATSSALFGATWRAVQAPDEMTFGQRRRPTELATTHRILGTLFLIARLLASWVSLSSLTLCLVPSRLIRDWSTTATVRCLLRCSALALAFPALRRAKPWFPSTQVWPRPLRTALPLCPQPRLFSSSNSTATAFTSRTTAR